jgi:hypothetical protein
MRNVGHDTHDQSLFSDLEDTLENDHLATYALSDGANQTTLTLIQSDPAGGPIAWSHMAGTVARRVEV